MKQNRLSYLAPFLLTLVLLLTGGCRTTASRPATTVGQPAAIQQPKIIIQKAIPPAPFLARTCEFVQNNGWRRQQDLETAFQLSPDFTRPVEVRCTGRTGYYDIHWPCGAKGQNARKQRTCNDHVRLSTARVKQLKRPGGYQLTVCNSGRRPCKFTLKSSSEVKAFLSIWEGASVPQYVQ